jgi:alkylation response protein AidB-like acyl-CoA dehydrogenase
MEFEFSSEDRLFRERLRAWLQENVPTRKRPYDGGPATREFDLEWQRTKFRGGWGGVAWPTEYGGQGLSLLQQIIWYEECGRAHAPPTGTLNIALSHGGPTLIHWGTDAQKAEHLPRIMRGEVVWAQGFSEPGAGSDLAGLRTSAVVDGDSLVVNGEKIWTSQAQLADYQILLARSEPGSKGYRGLSWIIVDMRTPGITVRPIQTLIPGQKYFAQVHYDNARIPLSNVVGPLHQGWRVAMTTLTLERGMLAASHAPALLQTIEDLIAMARERPLGTTGRPAIEDSRIASSLSCFRAEAAALRAVIYDIVFRPTESPTAGGEAAMSLLIYGDLLQRVRETSMEILGPESLLLQDEAERWTHPFLMDRVWQIAGGTAEIRRNIIAERLLGLPRSY